MDSHTLMKKTDNKKKARGAPASITPDGFRINFWGQEVCTTKKPSSARGPIGLEFPHFRDILYPEQRLPLNHAALLSHTPGTNWQSGTDLTPVAALGLHYMLRFIDDGDIPARCLAQCIADRLIEKLSEWRKHIFAWPHQEPFPLYGIQAPWISTAVHSLGLSLLLRVAYLNNDAYYEEAAQKIVRLYFLPIEDGGLLRILPSGSLMFEEFPCADGSMPLTPHLFSILALHEYVQYFDDHDVATILRGSVRGLQEQLPLYDLGQWVLFDLHPSRRCATSQEIIRVCTLLKIAGKAFENDDLAAMALKWFTYTRTAVCRRYYFRKRLIEHMRLRLFAQKYHLDVKYLKVAPR